MSNSDSADIAAVHELLKELLHRGTHVPDIPHPDELEDLLGQLTISDQVADLRCGPSWSVYGQPYLGEEEGSFHVLLHMFLTATPTEVRCKGLRVSLQNCDTAKRLPLRSVDHRGIVWFKNVPCGRYKAMPDEAQLRVRVDEPSREALPADSENPSRKFISVVEFSSQMSKKKDAIVEQLAHLLVPKNMEFTIRPAILAIRDFRASDQYEREIRSEGRRAAAFSSGTDDAVQDAVEIVARVLDFVDHLCDRLSKRCSQLEDITQHLSSCIDESLDLLGLGKNAELLSSVKTLLAERFTSIGDHNDT